MPGMMDTVLNIGLNDETVRGLIARSGNERFAYDSYRRLLQMYGDVVMGVDGELFEHAIDALKEKRGVKLDTELGVTDLQDADRRVQGHRQEAAGRDFPADPREQLWGSVEAVFRSWNTPRAVSYRNLNRLPHDMGTAVNVQTMVFGNMGDNSATGVAFTRDPSNGENFFYGEFLIDAQGEDVVAGTRTPQALNLEGRDRLPEATRCATCPRSRRSCRRPTRTLCGIREKLEKHYRNMQDIEFTIQDGRALDAPDPQRQAHRRAPPCASRPRCRPRA